MTLPRVLLTDPIDSEAQEELRSFAEVVVHDGEGDDSLRLAVRSAAGMIVRRPLPADIFDHADQLRGVVRHGAGTDIIPVEAATRRGIPVANIPGGNAQAVAEHGISLMLALVRRIAALDQACRQGAWRTARTGMPMPIELRGETLGIFGVGAIGQRIARIAHDGFGMRVLGFQRNLAAVPPPVCAVDLPDLLAESRFVVLACPLTPQTAGIVDTGFLARMRSDAHLVNISRGSLVDEAALVAALSAGSLAGAALDVLAAEPPPDDHPLFAFDNVVLTPHTAGLTSQSLAAIGRASVAEMRRMLAGERPASLVNPDIRLQISPPDRRALTVGTRKRP